MKSFFCKVLLFYMSKKLLNYSEDIKIIFRYKNVSQSIGNGSKIHDITFERFRDIFLLIFYSASLSFGEAYFKGYIKISGNLDEFVFAVDQNFENKVRFSLIANLLYLVNRIFIKSRKNSLEKSINNVRAHYDQDPEFYKLFLDKSMQYSCAYFPANVEGISIDEAQNYKKELISQKLLLSNNLKVLDIGCGWGGLSLHLAKNYGCMVRGITLSEKQLNLAISNSKTAGLDNLLEYSATDYRDVSETFDRIVSVGMFEHVGLKSYDQFFKKINVCLKEDGVALIHTIGRVKGPGSTDAFLEKYIFPGGYIPSLSEILPFIEKNNLIVTDIEFLHMHYAKTLKSWRKRFLSQSDFVDDRFGINFRRLWEYYLVISESAFRSEFMTVFQIQLAKKTSSIPSSRNYIYEKQIN